MSTSDSGHAMLCARMSGSDGEARIGAGAGVFFLRIEIPSTIVVVRILTCGVTWPYERVGSRVRVHPLQVICCHGCSPTCRERLSSAHQVRFVDEPSCDVSTSSSVYGCCYECISAQHPPARLGPRSNKCSSFAYTCCGTRYQRRCCFWWDGYRKLRWWIRARKRESWPTCLGRGRRRTSS